MKIVQLITDNREPLRDYQGPRPYFGTAPEALLQGFSELPEVEVHVVSCTQQPMNSPARLADNIHFHSLHVPKIGWLRTAYQGCIRAVRRKMKELRPDIVHGQGSERDQNISAVFSGFPNVLTIHGNMRLVAQVNRAKPFTFQWLAARLEHFTIPRSNGVVCITNYTREAVASLARQTWVLPNAVDRAFFDITPAPAVPRRILCVATIDHRKNQNALIQALDGLRARENFELVFLGGINRTSSYGQEFFRLIESRPWCTFLGFADRVTLRQHVAQAYAVVLPSLEDNCPMVVLEAMAAGVPVAAARVGGVPDLVRHGETGLMFDPLDSADMAGAIERLLVNSDQSLVERARVEAWVRFHPKVIATRHLEIYRQVLGR